MGLEVQDPQDQMAIVHGMDLELVVMETVMARAVEMEMEEEMEEAEAEEWGVLEGLVGSEV